MELASYRQNVFSQNGEDGVIAKIFDVLNITAGYVCEFGAWDGIHLSNTHFLYRGNPPGFSYIPILIESDPSKFAKLEKNLNDIEKKYIANTLINKDPSHPDCLNKVLQKFNIPDLQENFSLLSIDVDGPDYEIWKGFTEYKPKVVIIETSQLLNPSEKIYPYKDGGATPGILVDLAKEKGYELICHTGTNLIFVLESLFDKFQIDDNSIDKLFIYMGPTATLKCAQLGYMSPEQAQEEIAYNAAHGLADTLAPGLSDYGNPWPVISLPRRRNVNVRDRAYIRTRRITEM